MLLTVYIILIVLIADWNIASASGSSDEEGIRFKLHVLLASLLQKCISENKLCTKKLRNTFNRIGLIVILSTELICT